MKHLIVIYPGHVGEVLYVGREPDLETVQGFVGGEIETIPTFRQGYVLVVNNEGKLRGDFEVNLKATLILRPGIKDIIVGPALLMKAEGEELAGISSAEIQEWREVLRVT